MLDAEITVNSQIADPDIEEGNVRVKTIELAVILGINICTEKLLENDEVK